MGPCTFLVTSVVTGTNVSLTQQIKTTWQQKVSRSSMQTTHELTTPCRASRASIPAGLPLPSARQQTGPADRGSLMPSERVTSLSFKDISAYMFRLVIKKVSYENPATARLTVPQEVLAGIIGGTLACWNHPFEVARIEAQARAAANEPAMSMVATMRHVMVEHGYAGLFKVSIKS